MTALENYKRDYEIYTSFMSGESKYDWAATNIFDLTTYDGDLDERFVKDILEVCKVILEKRNFEYIKDEQNYLKYIIVCQLLVNKRWINWGTSIRGAWFERDETYIWDEKVPISESDKILKTNVTVPFTVENLKALIEFMEEE